VRLEPAAQLGSGERTSVERVRALYPDGSTASLVVKQYRAAGEGWVRESAALAVLPAGARGPRLVAEGDAPPIVILADVGDGPTVADALLGRDPEAAAAAVIAWAEAVAGLHAATRDLRPAFRRELAAREGDVHVADAPTAARIEDAVRLLDRQCGGLGVRVPTGAFDELRELAHRLDGSGTAALTPADTCPDNHVRVGDGLVLLDFEDAQWRHVAWDVAYLCVPWPSCWCSWRLPEPVSAAAVGAYRAIAAAAFPEVAEPAFEREVEAATVGWCMASAGAWLDVALAHDPPVTGRGPTPTGRARLLHRLERAATSPELPAAAELAARLLEELRGRWGDVPLALAPAFR
jgi:aminoglycoside/choline kinase family phosphotransferase